MSALPARGEVWWCEMAEIGRRPVVVLSRDAAIPRHRRTLVAPCTTTIRGLVSEVGLEPGEDPVPRRCVVNMDSVESVSLAVLVERSDGWSTRACGRSAWPSVSQSTARTDAAASANRSNSTGSGPSNRQEPCAGRPLCAEARGRHGIGLTWR